jgi:hypothetical protein
MLLDSTPTSRLSSLKTSNGQNCLQLFNFAYIIGQCTNLMSTKPGYAHEAIFGQTNMQWHLPEHDCLGITEIFKCRRGSDGSTQDIQDIRIDSVDRRSHEPGEHITRCEVEV